jgi:hypothetical protein
LYAADAAAQGEEVYIGGLGDEERLEVYRAAADQAAREYLAQAGAYADHPGLACVVIVVDGAVRVTVRATLHLPLSVPESPHDTTVGATGAAAVTLEP